MSFTEHCIMLRTTHILIPSVILSLTILGLAIIYNGGCMDAMAGEDNRLRIVGANGYMRLIKVL